VNGATTKLLLYDINIVGDGEKILCGVNGYNFDITTTNTILVVAAGRLINQHIKGMDLTKIKGKFGSYMPGCIVFPVFKYDDEKTASYKVMLCNNKVEIIALKNNDTHEVDYLKVLITRHLEMGNTLKSEYITPHTTIRSLAPA
jgi:hypothetical protein